MLAVITAVRLRLEQAGVPWRLAGSAALMLAGIPVRPSDVDVEVAEVDAARAARALGLPPPRHADGSGWSSLRAQGELAGVDVDVSGGLTVTGPGGTLRATDAGTVVAPGRSLPLLHPGEALARALVAGSAARRAKALAALQLAPPDVRDAALAYAEERARSAAR
ncbi:MAG: hypothetical protein ISP32_04925 [Thermoleophilia bacterium]|nr:hypothetical protein [Thermoleophilia bacterium]